MRNNPVPSHIVVLDDDEIDLHIIMRETQKKVRNCRFHSASGGHDLLRLLKSITPDFVICDVNLGCETGFNVADMVRQVYPAHHIPFIFITGTMRDGFERKAKSYPRGALLLKPARPSGNAAFVDRILRIYSKI